MGMFDDADNILKHCNSVANKKERFNGVKKYKIIASCVEKELDAKDIGWLDEKVLEEKLNDLRARMINIESIHGDSTLAQAEAIGRMKDRNVGGVGDIYSTGEDVLAAIEKDDYKNAAVLAGVGALKNIGPQSKVLKAVKGPNNVQVKKKKEKEKLKCGEGGTYYELKKKIAQAVGMERDHVPSGAALKKRAFELNGERELTPKQLRKIENVGHTLAIPKGIHMDFSLTYKSLNNKDLIAQDAGNLSKAAKRDMEAIKKGLDPECKKRYKKYADKIGKLSNDDYDKMLSKALKGK